MNLTLTGDETADELVKLLVRIRMLVTFMLKVEKTMVRARVHLLELQKRPRDEDHALDLKDGLQEVDDWLVNWSFDEVAIGQFLIDLCPELDKKVPREALFDAINTNQADRNHPGIQEHGDKASTLIFVLDLENSASMRGRDFIDESYQPLRWCHLKAFMNALKTNEKFDRTIHEGANAFFGGAFGDYRPRSLTERLTGVRA
ncbi:MAG: hypothetical protein Q8S12_10975 [Hydrogenophaga sp.]|uniref:hypothetical protein n=1 Tax=Hydrogenophaga sp. TaxID=1904254 RepID=UPI0027375CB8|nr:hypothetical protein [Hydrogenophaga sp.]MDP3627113.1 hypothetical protein [Hydrogenophaga sp.]